MFASLALIIAKPVTIVHPVVNALLLMFGTPLNSIAQCQAVATLELFIIQHLDNAWIAMLNFGIVMFVKTVLIAHSAWIKMPFQ